MQFVGWRQSGSHLRLLTLLPISGELPCVDTHHRFFQSPKINDLQIEVHPAWRNDDLVAHAHANGIVPTAYFPLGGKRPDGEKLWEVSFGLSKYALLSSKLSPVICSYLIFLYLIPLRMSAKLGQATAFLSAYTCLSRPFLG